MVNYITTMTKAGQYLHFKYNQVLIQRTLNQYKQYSAHTSSKMQITLLTHHLLLLWVELPTVQAYDLLGW